jgi:hypothetical protein
MLSYTVFESSFRKSFAELPKQAFGNNQSERLGNLSPKILIELKVFEV